MLFRSVYVSFGSEADTRRIIEELFKRGKTVFLPRVAGQRMRCVRYVGQALEKGAFGIMEPQGLKLEDLPRNLDKPLVVGESGATYYGRPIQLYPFVGEKAFLSYEGRSEALAIDVYQNVRQMALPYLSYYSPSEICWFGLEHMNLGYHDFNRLPNLTDGIFAGKPYKEGKPG